MFRREFNVLAVLVSFFAIGEARDVAAGEWDLTGFLGVELRVFPYEPAFSSQDDDKVFPSVFGQPEISFEWNGGNDRLIFSPFGRYDVYEDDRRHFDIRLANWFHKGQGWDLVIGLDRVFWGVVESRHLIDIINQVDQLEDIDEEDRLGQPMVNLNFVGAWGRAGLYVLPGFRELEFFDASDRLSRASEGIVIDEDRATFESNLEEAHVDVAARYEQTFGPLDVGLSYFRGTGREPRLIPTATASGVVLSPHYEQIDQASLDASAAIGNWLLKLEALGRFRQGRNFFATVGGFEYTLSDTLGTGTDLGLLVEYLYDDRDSDAPPVLLDNDVFLGIRLTFNDVQDTNLLAGVTVDVETQASTISFEASRRINDHWKLEAEARAFVNVPASDFLFGIRNDDFVQIRLLRFF